MDLKNKVAIVTGASRGIGIYIAERLARKGVNLALAARTEQDLRDTAEKIERFGTKVITVPTDVTKRADLKTLVRRTTQELGGVDLLVNNAGVEKLSSFSEIDLDDIEWIIKTNVTAVEWLTRLVVPEMVTRGSGHIVNIASMAGKVGLPYNAVYSSSKHALIGFTWSLRQELKPHGIGVSAVCPGFVTEAGMFASWGDANTPGIAKPVTPGEVAEATIRAVEKNRPEVLVVRGIGKVADVVHAVSPDFAGAVARRGGLYAYLEKGASRATEAQAH